METLTLTDDENESFLHIVREAAKINRHYELFLLLQGEVQRLLPHQIMISAWGDFRNPGLNFDVISPILGVRTAELRSCGIEALLKDLFGRWTANGRRKMLLNNAAARPITHSSCDCALHKAMRGMRSVLVHGVRNERDDTDSIYVALNPDPITSGRSIERFFSLVDPLIAQIDVAFRKVAALKSLAATRRTPSSHRADLLSQREQQIMKWVTDGKTNSEIAEIVGISSFTVKNHLQRIFRKLDASNRTEAVAKYHLKDASPAVEIPRVKSPRGGSTRVA